jgi:sugar lactone lactonase YvrE
VFLLAVFSSLALADEEQRSPAPETPGLALPNSAQELDALTQESQEVSTEPITDPTSAEELPHANLARAEAEELLLGVFGEGLEEASNFYDELKVEAFRSDHVAVVVPPQPGAAPGLLSSLLPLRVQDGSGTKEIVDLDLERSEGHLEPENPLAQVEIPAQLSEGIAFPGTGVRIDIARGETERAASEVGGASAFFPNIRTDSDLVVIAVPTGVETYTHLRTPEAPRHEIFNLTLPPGGRLEATPAGGAQVVNSNGLIAVSVPPPAAIDAGGDQIPADLEVVESSIVVSVDPPADAVYPILVDPLFESYNWSGGQYGKEGDWTEWNSPGFATGFRVWDGTGMQIYSHEGSTTPGNQGAFNYYVPRYWTDTKAGLEAPTTFIRNMKLWDLHYLIYEGGAPPYAPDPFMQMGLWSSNKGEFVSYGSRTGTQGQLTDPNYVYDLINPQESSDVKNGGFALATWSSSNGLRREVSVAQASVELSDKDVPIFGELGNVPQWVSSQTGDIKYKVSEPGLGIHNLRIRYAAARGGRGEGMIPVGCTGAAGSPCPRTAATATKPLLFDAGAIAQGENWANIYAVDPVGQWSEVGTSRIKVDRVQPELGLSGTLTEQSAIGTKLPQYALNLDVKDGDEATAAAATPIGTAGTAAGQLERPMGLAVDAAGNTWVADTNLHRVVEYDKSGNYVRQLTGSAEAGFGEPRGVAVAPNGNIWVAEKASRRFQQFTPTGQFVSKFTNLGVEPHDIAFSNDSYMWVTDPNAKKVFKFLPDGTLSKTISIPQPAGGTAIPFGIDVDNFGNAWIAVQGTDKVLEYSPSGTQLFSFGATGTETGKFRAPQDVTIAPSGNIFVSDGLNNRIQEFKPDGGFMRQFGTTGTASNQLQEPRGIDMAPGNVLHVADAGNKRIARWDHADRHPESGAVKTEVKVDGVLVDTYNPGCAATKNCSISREWVMNADSYSTGNHKVDVIATDGVGLRREKSLTVETHGDLQAPALALSGTMTEQATLGNTRPNYKLKVSATDPGSAEERKSGVASTSIKVDGAVVDSASPGCPAGSCSITREWTLSSNSYSAGSHAVEVKATDAAGRSTTKTLSIKIDRDTTPPQLNLSGALPGAPEGWVQEGTRSAVADSTDEGGYGVKQIRFLIDGVLVGESLLQTCEAGGCPKSKTFWINMTTYTGGAHQAVMAAEDGAGNVRKKPWTINLDPEGHISASEAEDTLEAVEDTASANLLGISREEAGYEGTAEGLAVDEGAEYLYTTGGGNQTAISIDPAAGLTVNAASASGLTNECITAGLDDLEEGGVAQGELAAEGVSSCEESVDSTEPVLRPVDVTPVSVGLGATDTTASDQEMAGVASNLQPHVDLVTRPLFDGAMSFAAIRDSSATESFSWNVNLDGDQELRAVDSKHVTVRYKNGPVAFTITAMPAHDAIGTAVPTFLTASGANIITLTVKHKVMGPNGQPFVYPVVGGAGWEGGFQTYAIAMPPSEEEPSEEEESGVSTERGVLLFSQGPPIFEPNNADTALLKAGSDSRKKKFKFVYCKPHEYPGGIGIAPHAHELVPLMDPKNLPAIVSECNNPALEGIYWKVSAHGYYHYIRGEWVWLKPEEFRCDKGGDDDEQPALWKCRGTFPGSDVRQAGTGFATRQTINVMGHWRFHPGKGNWIYGSDWATCFTLGGVLDPTPSKLKDTATQRPMLWERTAVHQFESCDWPEGPN